MALFGRCYYHTIAWRYGTSTRQTWDIQYQVRDSASPCYGSVSRSSNFRSCNGLNSTHNVTSSSLCGANPSPIYRSLPDSWSINNGLGQLIGGLYPYYIMLNFIAGPASTQFCAPDNMVGFLGASTFLVDGSSGNVFEMENKNTNGFDHFLFVGDQTNANYTVRPGISYWLFSPKSDYGTYNNFSYYSEFNGGFGLVIFKQFRIMCKVCSFAVTSPKIYDRSGNMGNLRPWGNELSPCNNAC